MISVFILILTVISLIGNTSGFHVSPYGTTFSDPNFYTWNGAYPSFKFDMKNNTAVNDNVDIKWYWWDNWSAGFGYVQSIQITYVNINKILYNYVGYTIIQPDFTIMPFIQIANITQNFTLDFENQSISKGTDVSLRFDMVIFDHYYKSPDEYAGHYIYTTITNWLIIKYTNAIPEKKYVDLTNLPITILIVLGVVLFVYFYTTKVIKGEKKRVFPVNY